MSTLHPHHHPTAVTMKELQAAKVPIPPGFVITSDAFLDFVAHNKLEHEIDMILAGAKPTSSKDVMDEARQIKQRIRRGEFPESLADQLLRMYLSHGGGRVLLQSFASHNGNRSPHSQRFLGCEGEANFFETLKRLWSDLFDAQSIYDHLLRHEPVMPRRVTMLVHHLPPLSVSGVFFTVDPTTHHKDQLLVKAVHGEGALEHTLTGADYYWISKRSGETHKVVPDRQRELHRYAHGKVESERVPVAKQSQRKLSGQKLEQLAKIASTIAQRFYYPQEVLFGFKGTTPYIFGVREFTQLPPKPTAVPSSIPKAIPRRSPGPTYPHTLGLTHFLTEEGMLPTHPVITGPLHVDPYPLVDALAHEHFHSSKLLSHQIEQKLQFALQHIKAGGGVIVDVDYQESRHDHVMPVVNALVSTRQTHPTTPIGIALRSVTSPQECAIATVGLRNAGLPRSSKVSYLLSIGIPRLVWEIDSFAAKGLDGVILELDSIGAVLAGDHRQAAGLESEALMDIIGKAAHHTQENGIRLLARLHFMPSHGMLELLNHSPIESLIAVDTIYSTLHEKIDYAYGKDH